MKKFDYYIVGEGFERNGYIYKNTVCEVLLDLIEFLKDRNLTAIKIEIKERKDDKEN